MLLIPAIWLAAASLSTITMGALALYNLGGR